MEHADLSGKGFLFSLRFIDFVNPDLLMSAILLAVIPMLVTMIPMIFRCGFGGPDNFEWFPPDQRT
jgi:hypothetical protein